MKVVELLAAGFEEIEALTPVDYLRRAGAEVVIAGLASEGVTDTKIIQGAHGISVVTDVDFDEYLASLNGELPDAVVIPGGMPGAANISSSQKAVDFICSMFEKDKYVCAICAAPIVVLAQTGILAGKTYTCYPGMEQKIADYVPDPSKINDLMEDSYLTHTNPFVVDGKLITGKGPGAAEQFAMAIVKEICGVDVMMKVKTSSVQR
ncbi:MAG: DJ-1/PfpI family protein [Treponema sp.]|uniref:DJ-1 family glyoxalase III n=1 Tax=Treponema sp. TaxID=166 RepID=UPI001B70F4E0|nr:DJ-1 family glyoxalase III [Treponema sp.]MBP5401808.1 DJ-1/PfpI family protein [Treponema sp.]MBR5934116.1 DJ-1/PfpI family protein [Treponema sp.]